MAITWGKLTDLIKNGKALDLDSALFFVFSDGDIQRYAVELNTGDPNISNYGQLFLNGVDANGVDLSSIGGDYSPYTERIKKFLGLPIDRVTLYQEGDFYRSFEFVQHRDGFVIRANTLKEDGGEVIDLRDRWGDAILGLNDESISKLNIEVLPKLIDYILSALLQ